MEISAKEVSELRSKTGAGMMDCKKALIEASGDFEKAIDILRKKGASVAAKRAERDAKEGVIITKIFNDSKSGVIIEINCETDFVAKSEDFLKFSEIVTVEILDSKPENIELLLSNPKIQSSLNELIGKCGEKIQVTRFSFLNSNNGFVSQYVHTGAKKGVIVQFDDVNGKSEAILPIAKDIAMQVVAMSPIAVNREDVDKSLVEKEVEVYKELAKKEGKPENMLEKIATGRLNKFFQENCLIEQAYIKENSKSIKNLVEEFNKANLVEAKVVKFVRYDLTDDNK